MNKLNGNQNYSMNKSGGKNSHLKKENKCIQKKPKETS